MPLYMTIKFYQASPTSFALKATNQVKAIYEARICVGIHGKDTHVQHQQLHAASNLSHLHIHCPLYE